MAWSRQVGPVHQRPPWGRDARPGRVIHLASDARGADVAHDHDASVHASRMRLHSDLESIGHARLSRPPGDPRGLGQDRQAEAAVEGRGHIRPPQGAGKPCPLGYHPRARTKFTPLHHEDDHGREPLRVAVKTRLA